MDMGYGRSTTQLMTVPIYVAASLMAVAVAYVSDRDGRRSPFIVGCLGLVVVGLPMYVPAYLHWTHKANYQLKVPRVRKRKGRVRWIVSGCLRHVPCFRRRYNVARQ